MSEESVVPRKRFATDTTCERFLAGVYAAENQKLWSRKQLRSTHEPFRVAAMKYQSDFFQALLARPGTHNKMFIFLVDFVTVPTLLSFSAVNTHSSCFIGLRTHYIHLVFANSHVRAVQVTRTYYWRLGWLSKPMKCRYTL